VAGERTSVSLTCGPEAAQDSISSHPPPLGTSASPRRCLSLQNTVADASRRRATGGGRRQPEGSTQHSRTAHATVLLHPCVHPSIHSPTHSLFHSLTHHIHSFAHSLSHSFVHSFTNSLTGLLPLSLQAQFSRMGPQDPDTAGQSEPELG
jgi:hypothetical protein